MILAVDIGNTNIVVGFLDKTNIVAQGRIGTDKRKTQMDFLINFRLMIQVYGINIKDIEGAILSSVVPEITHEVSQALELLLKKKPFIIGHGIKTGLNIKIMGDNLECVATDSYRLAKKSDKVDYKNEVNIILPGRNVIELEKIIPSDENIEVHIFTNKVLFKFENISFQTNLLAGNYPNTNNLIPNEFKYIIKANLSTFTSAIDRAALLTQGKDKNIVKMMVNDSNMVISSFASEIGKVEENLVVECNNKEKIEISFSSKYMLEALKTFKDEDILILLNSDIKPIIIKSVDDETLIQLILPIKTY